MKNTTRLRTASVESLIGQIAEDFVASLDRGEQPDIGDFAARHPEIATHIQEVLTALQALRSLSSGGAGTSATEPVDRKSEGQLGDYRIIREIGRGGMGVVYEAEQISLGRRVALKVLPVAAVLDAKQLQRFKNEAQAAAHLQHTNIVPVYAVGCERGVHYYAMQYIEGSTLGDVIHELRQLESPEAPVSVGPTRQTSEGDRAARSRSTSDTDDADTPDSDAARLTDVRTAANGSSAALVAFAPERSTKSPAFFRSVANLGVQAAETLEHAHEFGIIHRDIKPSNLLLDQRGNLWITDFGLARLESNPDLTMTGDILGTLRYMSPEQAAGKNLLLDHRTDIYSLGVTLYELLTLRPAIDGRDRQELLKQIADQDPRPPRRLNAAIPADLETIVLKATAKEPHRRYATAKELAEDLDRFLEDKPIRAKRTTLMERAAKWSRRHRHLVASAVVVLVVAVSALSISTVLLAQKQAEIVRQRNTARVQSTRAEAARGREREQRELAEKREKETQQVSDFQAAMLSEIDVEAMGRGIKERFREQVRAALERQYVGEPPHRRKRTPEEIEAELAAFDQRADAAQAVDVARRVMDEFVLARAADALEEQFGDQPLVQAQLHDAIGNTYRELGLYAAAEPHLRAPLAIRQRELGEEHELVATSLNNLAELLRERGDYARAEPLYREALTMQRKLLGDEHPAVAVSLNNLGLLLWKKGDYAGAEPLHREALAMTRKLLGDEHLRVAISLNNLALVLKAVRDFGAAEPLYREALAVQRKLLGDEHLRVANSLNNLAELLRVKGDPAAAEPLHREALAIYRAAHAGEHPHTAMCLHHLAKVVHRLGGRAEAEQLAQESLEMYLAHPEWSPKEHEHALSILSDIYVDAGRAEEAAALLDTRIHMKRRRLPPDSIKLASALARTGTSLLQVQRYDAAEALLRECLEIRGKAYPDDHPQGWLKHSAMSLLGGALAGQAAELVRTDRERSLALFQEAEALLLDGYNGMKDDPRVPTPSAIGGLDRKREALERIIKFYESWDALAPNSGKAEQAAEWRTELEKLRGP